MFARSFALLGAFLLVGCSTNFSIPSGVRVGGKVFLPDNRVATAGRLILKPTGGAYLAFADVKADGSFTLVNQREEESVVPGKYKVYLALTNPKDRTLRTRIPAKYHNFDAETSDVEVTIDSSNSNLEIRLKS